MVYVTATDNFMSGWGLAKDKKNKLIIECKDFETAEKVSKKLKARYEMKYININAKKPYYSPKEVYVSYYDLQNDVWTKEVTK